MYSGLGWVMGVWDWGEIQDYSGKGRLPENSASGECGISDSPSTQAHHCASIALLRLTFTNKRIFYKSISNDGY